jgi:serine/threonine protein kinase
VSKDPLGILRESDKQDLLKEIKIMKDYHHPFIVKIIDDFSDSNDHLCAV